MLGVVGLILAFGLSLALSRYEDRRAAIVDETNAIGTTYLRAQTLDEPARSRSLNLLVTYTESAVRVSEYVPGSTEEEAAVAKEGLLQRRLWALAGRGPRRRSRGERPAALRRDAERDDRRPDHPGCRAQQPGPRRGHVPGDTRRRDCARGAVGIPGPRRSRAHRPAARDDPGRVPALRHGRPRSTDPRPDHGARHGPPRAAQLDAAPPAYRPDAGQTQ